MLLIILTNQEDIFLLSLISMARLQDDPLMMRIDAVVSVPGIGERSFARRGVSIVRRVTDDCVSVTDGQTPRLTPWSPPPRLFLTPTPTPPPHSINHFTVTPE